MKTQNIKERIQYLETHERKARACFYDQADKKWLDGWTYEKYCELLFLRSMLAAETDTLDSTLTAYA